MPEFLVQPERAWIAESVLDELTAECCSADSVETGGVLLGYWGNSPQEPVITHSIGPGPEAVHERDRFQPDHRYQLGEIARLYESSDRTLQYLGDWHSHPTGGGGLSAVDRRTLRRIARCRTARAESPLMVVLAGESAWELYTWIQERIWRWRCVPSWAVRQLRISVF